MDPYEVLGVPRNATQKQIKQAYRRLAAKHYPDKYTSNPLVELAAEKMRQINEACEILSDPQRRALYDRFAQGVGVATAQENPHTQWTAQDAREWWSAHASPTCSKRRR